MIIVKLPLLVRLAAEETGDLPAACLLEVAQLLATERQDGIDRHVTLLPGRRHHLDRSGHDRIGWGVIGENTYQVHAELVDDGGILLRRSPYLDAITYRKGPIGCVGMGRICELVGGFIVERRLSWRTEYALALRVRHDGGFGGVGDDRLPARCIGSIQAQCLREIVDAGLALVGYIRVFRNPEEARSNQTSERGTILPL